MNQGTLQSQNPYFNHFLKMSHGWNFMSKIIFNTKRLNDFLAGFTFLVLAHPGSPRQGS